VTAWNLFVYRLPLQPSRARVGVWRALRRLGSLPIGQSILALPDLGDLDEQLDTIEARIAEDGGTSWRFRLDSLPEEMEQRLQSEWNALRGQEFAEIVEECRTKFNREIEFEIFRGNLTAAEAEEIEADLDKIKAWFQRISERDWFEAPSRADAEAEIAASEALYNDFAEKVYLAETTEGLHTDAPLDIPWGTTSVEELTVVPDKPTKKRKAPKNRPSDASTGSRRRGTGSRP
jgi:hypothetical protein